MFKDREEAGKRLAQKLKQFKNKKDAVVLGITRGGVIVAREISKSLNLPLDIIVVKKIGAPSNPELAIGAVGPKGIAYWDEDLCRDLNVSYEQKEEGLKNKNKEREDLQGRLKTKKQELNLKDKHVILADDGIATGATVLVSQKFLRKEKAKEIILATPLISKDTFKNIKKYFDRILSLEKVDSLISVSQFYNHFPQVTDEEAIEILNSK